MCFSAQVDQNLQSLARRLDAVPDLAAFRGLFAARVGGASIKVSRALEANFLEGGAVPEPEIAAAIAQHRAHQAHEWESELFAQRRRLNDAERALRVKVTKKAENDRRIAGNKVAWYQRKLAELRAPALTEADSRIFPFGHAPVVVVENGRRLIRPMRYHCRPQGKPAWYDKKYDGLYNARRDNLGGFWKHLFGRRHAILVAPSFYENVALHDFERRELRPDEKPANVVLHFNPRQSEPMLVACLYDHWTAPGQPDLWSFAAITDEPPPEVAATGHDRCIVPLRPEHVEAWLNPESASPSGLYALLDDRARPYYEHRLAA